MHETGGSLLTVFIVLNLLDSRETKKTTNNINFPRSSCNRVEWSLNGPLARETEGVLELTAISREDV